jgi:hypothetical protein
VDVSVRQAGEAAGEKSHGCNSTTAYKYGFDQQTLCSS